MTHHVSTIRVHITNFNNTLEKKKKKERKDCHFEVTKISIMSCLYTASLLRPRERELPSFYLFYPQ